VALPAGIAGGHPETARAGLEILEAGGSAADAAVSASLASCVAETVMTGLLGGGHALYHDGPTGHTAALDCFVTVPGLDAGPHHAELVRLEVPFGAELVHYAVGPASWAVPGLPAGLEALWRAHGRLTWGDVVEPALRLARDGVEVPPTHAACLAMLASVMTMNEGAAIYAPGGTLLAAGDTLRQPGLVTALELLRDEGAATVYRGEIAERLLALSEERDGLLTRADLHAYAAAWREPEEVGYAGTRFLTRGDLSGIPGTLASLPPLRGLSPADRMATLVHCLSPAGPDGHTTNVVAVDRDGSVCVLTTSLGLGSGDFLPGLDLHLNSMLGEIDLLRGPLEPGLRMGSMMAPSLAVAAEGPVLAIGAAGGTRLRTALVGVAAGVLDEGLAPPEAVERPRFHPAGGVVNAEPGVDEEGLARLHAAGWKVRRWPERHHYFGGVSLVAAAGPAADPRRGGLALRA
jgi:gamma-glutamyltranspeptidase / glutathione hydrolase